MKMFVRSTHKINHIHINTKNVQLFKNVPEYTLRPTKLDGCFVCLYFEVFLILK